MSQTVLSECISQFLDTLSTRKSSQTQDNYARYLEHFLRINGDLPVSHLELTHLSRFRTYLATKSGLSPSSQNYHLIALRQFIKYLLTRGLTTLTPADISLHTVHKTTDTHYDLEDLKSKLIHNLPDNLRDQLILNLLFSTGLKVSEVVALKRQDIFPNFRQISVGDPPRTMLLSPSTSLLVEKYLQTRHDSSPILFTTDKSANGPMNVRTVQRIVKRFANQYSVDLTPSAIRNLFASDLFDQGVTTDEAKELLGHKHKTSTIHYKSELNTTQSLEPS